MSANFRKSPFALSQSKDKNQNCSDNSKQCPCCKKNITPMDSLKNTSRTCSIKNCLICGQTPMLCEKCSPITLLVNVENNDSDSDSK